jgi:putative ABC transport system permease protein
MDSFFQDARYAIRSLLGKPGFAAVAVIALALGIGANSAIFSVVNSLLLNPLPYEDPNRLVQVWETSLKRGRNAMPASYPNFADWRDKSQVFKQVVAYSDWSFNLTGVSDPERIRSAIVSPDFFSALGIKPRLGRVFLSEEDQKGKDLVVVISESFWRRRFGADPAIVGKTLSLGDNAFTVVGVIPEGAQTPVLPADIELWAPVSQGFGFDNRRGHYLRVIARLGSGVTLGEAQTEMSTLAAQLEQQYPDSNSGHGVRLVPLHQQIVGDYQTSLYVMLGAVVFVLLIASANVANMLLARAAGRQKEIAIRTALGAARLRVVRQLLTESLLLAGLGGCLGLLIALWGIDLLVALSPPNFPRVTEVAVDGRVLGFTFVVSLVTGVIFGLVPAIGASRPDLNVVLKEGGRTAAGGSARQRARSLLVVSEIALALVLLVGTGLLLRSFLRLQQVSPGFNPENVLTMQLDLSGPNFKTGAQVIAFHTELLDRIKAQPGVESASTRSFVPIASDASFAFLSFAIQGRPLDPNNRPVAYYNGISNDYFQTLMIPVLRGREFDGRDGRKTQQVAIVNETLSRRYFPDEDVIGKRINLDDDPNVPPESWAEIVGVVGDTKPRSLEAEPVPEMYMPFVQQAETSMSLMVRTTVDPKSVAAAIRKEVLALDKDQPVYSIRTLDAVLSESVAVPRFRALLIAIFSVVALVLATVGIYGVMSYSVTQRTHEIGIRMALGARPRDVMKMVVGHGFALALISVGIGLVASFFLTGLLSDLLYGVSATDPVTFIAVPMVLTGVALAACFVPARRASKVDPMIALRYE